MVISSINSPVSRSVTPSNSSSDRQQYDEKQTTILETKVQERAVEQRAVQDKIQQQKAESQRRLDGRLINFGYEQSDSDSYQQKRVSMNQSRVNEAYSPPQNNHEVTSQQNNPSSSYDAEINVIDIVV